MPPGNQQPLLNTCPSCQEIIDVSGVRPYEKIHCPLCEDTIRVRTVFNHFTLKEEIGQGGMSRVFRAVDNNLGREVALKILHSRYEDQPQLAAHFEREAKITASITHPNVVQVYSAGRDQGYYYIAMELLPNKCLEHLLSGGGRIPEAEALRIIHEIAQGLAAAFQHGMIHRDVKPGNILLDSDGRAKLADFGLASMQGAEEDPLAEVWATPFYVPPEKLWGRPEDFRSDIYSLGATLYHMIAGRPPHYAETDSIQELITIKSKPLDLRVASTHMSEPTIHLITRMMAYDPPARYASYEDLLAAIETTRRRVDARSSSAKAFPLWAKAGAAVLGVAGLALVGVLAFGGLKSASPSASTPALATTSPLIVSAEDAALAQLLPKGREALASKDLKQAVASFKELAENERARADWRTWAAFHLGIESLFHADLELSRSCFTEAATLSTTLDRDLSAFFAELAQIFNTELLPPPTRNGTSDLAGLRSLVLGLKSWASGNFHDANLQLAQFLQGQPSEAYSWAAFYRSRVEPIHTDTLLLESVPKYKGPDEIQALTEHLDRLASIHKQLHEDRCKRSLAATIATFEKHIGELAAAAQAAASNKALAGDFALLREGRRATLEKCASRHFSECPAIWKSVSCQTDAGKKSAAHHAEACQQAARFPELLSTAFTPEFSYEGEILRGEGKSFTAKLVRITPEMLTVDLGFGPTPLKMESISNEGLLKIAQATVLKKGDPALVQAACYFAWFAGLEAEARQLAETAGKAPGFQERWEAITRPLPNSDKPAP